MHPTHEPCRPFPRPGALLLLLSLLAGSTAAQDDPLADTLPPELDRPRPPLRARAPVVRGELLQAPPWVREEAHEVHLRLGLPRTRIRITSVLSAPPGAPWATEVALRVVLPGDVEPRGAQVCLEADASAPRCRSLRPAPPGSGPSGAAEAYRQALEAATSGPRGRAAPAPAAWLRRLEGRDERERWELRAGPLPPGGRLRVRLEALLWSRALGGELWLRWPARGDDVRAARTRLLLARGPGVGMPRWRAAGAEGPTLRLDPQRGAVASAPLRIHRPLVHVEGLDGPGAAHWTLSATAPWRPPRPRRVLVALDASRSTEGPTANRLPRALAALLAALPAGSRVAFFAFGEEATPAGSWSVAEEASLLAPLRAVERASGDRWTRLEAVRAELRRHLQAGAPVTDLVVVGDGGASRPGFDVAAWGAALRRRGVRLGYVPLGAREPWRPWRSLARASGGRVLPPPPEPFEDLPDELLAAWLRGLWARPGRRGTCPRRDAEERWRRPCLPNEPWSGETLLAGEGVVVGEPGGSVASPHRPPPAGRWSHPRPRRVRLAGRPLRIRWRRAAPLPWVALPAAPGTAGPLVRLPPPERPGGVVTDETQGRRRLPRAALLASLRQRLIPPVRACFRQERRGRSDRPLRTELHFAMAERELLFAEVRGAPSERLRRCVLRALERLPIPPFDGVALVTYPLRSAPVPTPPRLRLREDLAAALDELFEPVPPGAVRPLAGEAPAAR